MIERYAGGIDAMLFVGGVLLPSNLDRLGRFELFGSTEQEDSSAQRGCV